MCLCMGAICNCFHLRAWHSRRMMCAAPMLAQANYDALNAAGDGGNQEGLYKTFAAQLGTCFDPACANVTANTNPYVCPTFQGGNWAPIGGAQPS
jgi:hypothetical protein